MNSSNSSADPAVKSQTLEKQRKTPALLPPFEPVPSSSPTLPRSRKRKHEDGSPCHPSSSFKHYPTPVPTSSTGILPSSPPPPRPNTRPGLTRTASNVSERIPLSDVPSLDVPANGEAVLLGRSSNASQYQLSANRLISRVHVRVTYKEADGRHVEGQILVECLGWNGLKVHCRGQRYELAKGDSFSSDKPSADIMLDVQDSRVLVHWPANLRKGSATGSDAAWDGEDSPSRSRTPAHMPSSPPVQTQLHSPISPSPRPRPDITAATTFIGLPASEDPPAVHVFEDEPSADESKAHESAHHHMSQDHVSIAADSSPLSSPDRLSDRDEENDPIVHSFGPFGDNLLPRMASFQAASPDRRRDVLGPSVSPKQAQQPKLGGTEHSSHTTPKKAPRISKVNISPIRNHVVNQLAFSRLHALPLSIIYNNVPITLRTTMASPSKSTNVPRELATDHAMGIETNDQHESIALPTANAALDDSTQDFTQEDLQMLLDQTPCVGAIEREGKDAAGKPLENEFYYVPELDANEGRRAAVEGSRGKPGLRAVRKQHKQYYWKRPRN